MLPCRAKAFVDLGGPSLWWIEVVIIMSRRQSEGWGGGGVESDPHRWKSRPLNLQQAHRKDVFLFPLHYTYRLSHMPHVYKLIPNCQNDTLPPLAALLPEHDHKPRNPPTPVPSTRPPSGTAALPDHPVSSAPDPGSRQPPHPTTTSASHPSHGRIDQGDMSSVRYISRLSSAKPQSPTQPYQAF